MKLIGFIGKNNTWSYVNPDKVDAVIGIPEETTCQIFVSGSDEPIVVQEKLDSVIRELRKSGE